MNTTRLPVRPEVAAFVERVTAQLDDLDAEERQELTEGLEADLSDQVAEGHVLGDPEAYAHELRVAAGFAPRRTRTPQRAWTGIGAAMDAGRERWERWVARPRVQPVWSVIRTLQPVWWVARGWVAAIVLCRALPGWNGDGLALVPGVHPVLGAFVLLAAVVVSVMIGAKKIWPGRPGEGRTGFGRTQARAAVLVLNVLAVLLTLFAFLFFRDGLIDREDQRVWKEMGFATTPGVSNNKQPVCNIFAFDSSGKPIRGVQLYDQRGAAMDVECGGQKNTKVPWMLGDVQRWNVFPLAVRERPARTARERDDLTSLPGVDFPKPRSDRGQKVTHPVQQMPKAVSKMGEPGKK